MQKRYSRRTREPEFGRKALILGIPIGILVICLAWIWKADRVKAYSSIIRQLETQKKEITAENTEYITYLATMKSFTEIEKIAFERFGLTQKVMSRIRLADPVVPPKSESLKSFADNLKVYDWVERIVFDEGRVTADTGVTANPKKSGESGKKFNK